MITFQINTMKVDDGQLHHKFEHQIRQNIHDDEKSKNLAEKRVITIFCLKIIIRIMKTITSLV